MKDVDYFNNGSDQVPKQESLDRFFKIMNNKDNHPVLIHYYQAIGRTKMYLDLY